MTGHANLHEAVHISVGDAVLEGLLHIPANARGLVIFAHGSGSSRFSQRNQFVASRLQARGLGTLLFDLLTSEEEGTHQGRGTSPLRFDIGLLAARLKDVTLWVADEARLSHLDIGYFGASTGAAAALIAAADLSRLVSAVVSRGGRADLAKDALVRVRAPTLLIVGGADPVIVELNKRAQAGLQTSETRLSVVADATHLFEEAGALEEVADLAAAWFAEHLGSSRRYQKRTEDSAHAPL